MNANNIESAADEGVRFLQAIFAPTDLILHRPTESWTEAGKKKTKVDYKATTYNRGNSVTAVLEYHRKRSEEAHANIFFGVCPRHDNKGKFDKAWQIRVVRVLWADLDHTTVEEALKRCKDAGLRKLFGIGKPRVLQDFPNLLALAQILIARLIACWIMLRAHWIRHAHFTRQPSAPFAT